ncbi:hypothetical protein F5884DRAFT_321016 [Xylogone sp. PMI_703]|nr:hypothetical protein F5884DRAFT_321016 [Xylogone sp. PMI_703]
MEESNPELESFRQQWRAEVSARSKDTKSATTSSSAKPSHKPSRSTHIPIPRHRATKAPVSSHREEEDPDYHVHTPSFDSSVATGGAGGAAGPSSIEELDKTSSGEPKSALEHYEKAVEKEALGSLGDSLNLYRKAFRMDHRVDQLYKNKHFPHTAASSTKHASKASISGPTAAPQAPAPTSENLTITQLIHSFSSLKIEPAPPPVEGAPAPPSPLATLPHEILVHILEETAILDIASFARVAQVCKRLAYLILTEERIWKRVCLGPEIGFGAMRYRYGVEIDGTPVVDIAEEGDSSDDDIKGDNKIVVSPYGNTSLLATIQLSPSPYPSYHSMLRHRPRIRFPGVYISTVNYIRPGQASASQLTWNNPVHIVTYYRYLRFFRDGSCLSLLTTAEPADVVYHMTLENYELHRNTAGHRAERDRDRERDRVGVDGKGPHAHLPSAVMANALRGRWKLSGGVDSSVQALQQPTSTSIYPAPAPPSSKAIATTSTAEADSDNEPEPEGDIIIETEGIGKYIYVMHLSLLSSAHPPHHITKGGKRNNKLTWKGFWSYNRLTDDFGEFALRNDKAFFWSRVGAFARA